MSKKHCTMRDAIAKEVKKEMFRLFKQKVPEPVKVKFYSPDVEYAIVFKEMAIDKIKSIKGWKTDSEMARHLGLTRQYICNLRARKTCCTHTVITRVASAVGNVDENWHIFFQLRPVGFINANGMQYNQAKARGQVPYDRYSITAEMRAQDHQVEIKQP